MNQTASYYNNLRPSMLAYVPPSAQRILEIGCAAGKFGAHLKNDLNAEVWGIEIHEASGRAASKVLDKVLIMPVEEALAELPEDYFDCIICNDVIEHLADPFSLLERIPTHLTDDGTVVASIPNVRYWPNLFDLVFRGNWDYVEQGILDKTHLRFFTRNSIQKTFQQCNYLVHTLEGISPYWSRKFKLFNLLTLGSFKDCAFLQFAVVAQPARQR